MDERKTMLDARNSLWSQYNETCRKLGNPSDYVPDEQLYHALRDLDHALGLDPSDWVENGSMSV
jgi:hypothetical protein